MSPCHVQHRRTLSALYCSCKPTDIIGTKRSDWFVTQCKDPAAFKIKLTKNGNLGHIRFKMGLLLSSYAQSQPREFFTGCYRSLETPCVLSTTPPPPPHHPNGIPVQYALILHTRGSQSRTQASNDDGKILIDLLNYLVVSSSNFKVKLIDKAVKKKKKKSGTTAIHST